MRVGEGISMMRDIIKNMGLIAKLCAACVLTACVMIGVCGCDAGAKAKEAADDIAIQPAMGESYEAALAAVQEKASDAKLLAVRLSAAADSSTAPEWMYLFISHTRVCAYTVFMSEGQATAAEYAQMSFTEDEFNAIPDPSVMQIDADQAYDLVKDTLAPDQVAEDVSIWLMTYVKEDADPTEYAMKWVFSFNEDIEEDADGNEVRPFAYYVDAYTGDVVSVEMTTSDQDSQPDAAEEDESAGSAATAEAQALLGSDVTDGDGQPKDSAASNE